MCRLLVDRGADMRLEDEDRDTPYECAKDEKHNDVCAYLQHARSALAERELRVGVLRVRRAGSAPARAAASSSSGAAAWSAS